MERLEKRVDVVNASRIELTQKVIRTAYYIAKNDKPYSNHPDLIELQTLNGANLGMCLYSRSTATVMIDMIASEMCRKICNRILEVDGKISILVDESTTISNKTNIDRLHKMQNIQAGLSTFFVFGALGTIRTIIVNNNYNFIELPKYSWI
ncbi:hypothetical protein LOD99_1486 [Oopsacas minuta]|uniref:DUF659 domain-containing protein n=1 Tax=Oopsacas minuta TaxID=111878 RepID=A0AAV7K632_9METZ|nr:hypothetical protein LOD99_1486 [Oopsacas minuta]